MNKSEIITGDKNEGTDISDNVNIEEIISGAESMKRELEIFLKLMAEKSPTKEKFLEVADRLQKEMGNLNPEINMIRRKYGRQ